MTHSVDITFTVANQSFVVTDVLLHDYDPELAAKVIDAEMPRYFTGWYRGMLMTKALEELIVAEVRHVLKNGLEAAMHRLDDLDRTKTACHR